MNSFMGGGGVLRLNRKCKTLFSLDEKYTTLAYLQIFMNIKLPSIFRGNLNKSGVFIKKIFSQLPIYSPTKLHSIICQKEKWQCSPTKQQKNRFKYSFY